MRRRVPGLMVLSAALWGQAFGALAAPSDIALNVAGATTSPAAPKEFDPLTATDAALAQYGYPPRPDAKGSPDSYAHWARAMSAIKTRIVPELRVTNIRHRPNMQASRPNGSVLKASSGLSQSKNWSGYVATNALSAFDAKSSFSNIMADYVVPLVTNSSCDGGWDYSSQWIGIDGYNSGDVLQGGSETDAYCSGSVSGAYYFPWYEWYPNYETQITNMTIVAGDDLFVEVWADSATKGKFFIENLNSGVTATITFKAPAGTNLVGNSAEWIVERPEVGGSLANISNYTADYFSGAIASNFAKAKFRPGALGLEMTDNNGAVVSTPSLIGAGAILFNHQ